MLRPARCVITQANATYPLAVTAKCYRPQNPATGTADSVTLIFLHCVASHKEVFEPTIAELFAIFTAQSKHQNTALKLREVWSIECPTHGESAVLNENIFRRRPELGGMCQYHIVSINWSFI